MLYTFLKIWVRLGATIFCRRIIVNLPQHLKDEGPLLIAANHPNSFLDAIIIDILFGKPVWSLARGDVFRKAGYIRVLNKLKILPVYRTTEGVENLEINYKTFDACKEIFKENGIVLMFSEGRCINEWHLRPLKKGTARLALSAWEDGIPLKVLPAGINFSSFSLFGKNVFLNFGKIISVADVERSGSDGIAHASFNEVLRKELTPLVYEIADNDHEKQRRMLSVPIPLWKKIILFVPALTGMILHAPLYYPAYWFTIGKTKRNDHFDSVMTAIVVFLYPFYLVLISCLLYYFTGSALSWTAIVLLPLTARASVEVKRQVE